MDFMRIGPEGSEEMSEYLHPIWHEVFDELMPPEEAEYIFSTWTNPDAIRSSIEHGYEYGYLEREGKRMGMYSFRICPDSRFYINKLYLEQSYRGRGLGQEALADMFSLARREGCTEAYLNVYYRNERAFRAYMRAGMTDFYHCLEMIGDGVVRNDYVMRMKL